MSNICEWPVLPASCIEPRGRINLGRFNRVAVMLARRTFICVALYGLIVGSGYCEDGDVIMLRMRIDEGVRQAIPPILQQNLSIEPDASDEAREMKRRSPAVRAAPVIFIVVGGLALPVIWKVVQAALRQVYYGGVLLDLRSQPPLLTSDPKIPANVILVIDANGKVERLTSEQFTPATLGQILIAH